MSLELFPDQSDLLEDARTCIRRGAKSVLIQLPTGGGKTVIAATMCRKVQASGRQAFFVVHRRELVKQAAATFREVGVDHGYCAAGFPMNRKAAIQVCSIQTLIRRVSHMPQPAVIFWDEAHHLAALSWGTVYRAFPGAVSVGLSATPERLDGAGLAAYFEQMVCGPSTRELIEMGRLCDFRLFAPPPPNTQGLHTQAGDFVRAEAEALMDTPAITGDAVAHYSRYARGRRAVAFCVSIRHSQHVAEQFRAAGFKAAHLDGDTHLTERDSTIEAFSRGELEVLCNVDLFGEGFDLPALECSILLRPTQSLAMYLQQVGRALRVFPGKEGAIILDHAGNSMRHGRPDDDFAWTLAGRKRAKKADDDEDSVKVKTCPKCFAAVLSFKAACACGHRFHTGDGREVEQRDGELVEVDAATLRHQRLVEQGRATTEEDLVALGRSRGMKRPELWARHIIIARTEKAARRKGAT